VCQVSTLLNKKSETHHIVGEESVFFSKVCHRKRGFENRKKSEIFTIFQLKIPGFGWYIVEVRVLWKVSGYFIGFKKAWVSLV
jgi:hypothetical protein